MQFFVVKSSKINNTTSPYFLGIQYRYVAKHFTPYVHRRKQLHRRQIRIGLIWWHLGVTFSTV